MKILFVSSQALPCPGGVHSYIRSIMPALVERGHQVDLLCLSDIVKLSTLHKLKLFLYMEQLRLKANGNLPELIQRTEVTKHAFRYLFTLRDPREYDMVHTQCGISSAAVRDAYTDLPFVGTIHGCYYSEHLAMTSDISVQIQREADLLRMYDVDAVNAPTRVITVSSYLDPNLPPIPEHKHVVIHNGVNTNIFFPESIPRRTSIIRIAGAGFLEPHKGYDVLLNAFVRLQSYNLPYEAVVFGTGSMLHALQTIAEEHRLNVTFRGHVEQDELARELRRTDIFVQPSRLETFGLSVTEAMASGCVPVCTNVGGIPDQICHMKNGILVEKDSAESIADALRLLILSPSLRKRLSTVAHNTVRRSFTIEAVAEKLEQLYLDITRNPNIGDP